MLFVIVPLIFKLCGLCSVPLSFLTMAACVSSHLLVWVKDFQFYYLLLEPGFNSILPFTHQILKIIPWSPYFINICFPRLYPRSPPGLTIASVVVLLLASCSWLWELFRLCLFWITVTILRRGQVLCGKSLSWESPNVLLMVRLDYGVLAGRPQRSGAIFIMPCPQASYQCDFSLLTQPWSPDSSSTCAFLAVITPTHCQLFFLEGSHYVHFPMTSQELCSICLR
jgi:hypothetical protein